jgi:hypothetical protein
VQTVKKVRSWVEKLLVGRYELPVDKLLGFLSDFVVELLRISRSKQ